MNNKGHIIFQDSTFLLRTRNSSFLFRISSYGHLEFIHYGSPVSISDALALADKRSAGYGDSIIYCESDPSYCLNRLPQLCPSQGRGDYREPAVIIVDEDGHSPLDLRYRSHEISADDTGYPTDLPVSRRADELLTVTLTDEQRQIDVQLFFKLFHEEDVIVRSARIINNSTKKQMLRRLMSSSLDLMEDDLVEMSFHGEWAREMGLTETPITESATVNCSRVGFSSSGCNPGYILRRKDTTEDAGKAWGFNLIYSGNHYNSTALNHVGLCRTMIGMLPEGLNWLLEPGSSFTAPEAVLSFAADGLNGLSGNFHDFINRHVVPEYWQYRHRPVLINSWEGFGFSFTEDSLLSLAEQAGDLGCELFVLDDGWFRERNNDLSGLGNYDTDLSKLPEGLGALADRIRKKGLQFGLWVEPESVSVESDLYRCHPDWAIHDPLHDDLYGRHQLLLDLTRKDVQDFIVENVTRIIEETKVSYIKWDMNRQLLADDQNYAHRYLLGLYSVLERIFSRYPQLLLESCSSGGNRFDLGMACFSPQIWTSDDTDPVERIRIQKNASYLYPLSMMGAHVAAEVSAQSLRRTPLSLRFNVAAYGDLGYELDLGKLSDWEKKEISRQIAFYKLHRRTFQFGQFRRYCHDCQHEQFSVSTDEETIATVFRRQLRVGPGYEKLVIRGLPEGNYAVRPAEQAYQAAQFNQLFGSEELSSPKDGWQATAAALAEGIVLNNVYTAAGYSPEVRIPLDYGSEMYLVSEEKKR
ncbi:MAG: alpha-galactosidase [Erysipelotrichaceae bacterium]|nr:alpha-galactosidase [Erysipelotrichaceae bacterium]